MAEDKCFVDLCYLLDCTGTMEDYIINAKDKIKQIARFIKDKFNAILRVALVGYRDVFDKKPFELLSFTIEEDKWIAFLEQLAAHGGGDTAEDVFAGYEQVINLQWQNKIRVLIHIIDAQQHGKLFTDGICDDLLADKFSNDQLQASVEKYMRTLVKKNIDYYVLETNAALTAKMMPVLKEAYDKNKTKNFPLTTFTLNTIAEELLKLTISSLSNSISRVVSAAHLNAPVKNVVNVEEAKKPNQNVITIPMPPPCVAPPMLVAVKLEKDTLFPMRGLQTQIREHKLKPVEQNKKKKHSHIAPELASAIDAIRKDVGEDEEVSSSDDDFE